MTKQIVPDDPAAAAMWSDGGRVRSVEGGSRTNVCRRFDRCGEIGGCNHERKRLAARRYKRPKSLFAKKQTRP